MKNNRNHNGFTLIEAMITITIAAILLSLAIPSFSKMIERNRISSATNEFIAAMMLTRSEAVTRTIPISICTSDNGTSCNNALDNYAKGWIIFSDCNRDGLITTTITTCDFDGDGSNDKDIVIKIHNGLQQLSIIGESATAKDHFTYRVSGRPNTLASFRIGSSPSSLKKKVTIALTGRVKLCTIGHTDCP